MFFQFIVALCLFSSFKLFILFHSLLEWSSKASWPQWQVITIKILSALLLSSKCLPWTPPPRFLIVSCLSVLLVHAEWLGFLIIFCPLLPQLMEQPGARMSYKGSTFIGKLEELSLSGLPLELRVRGGSTVVVVVAAAQTGVASSLHGSRRQWRQWKETEGNCSWQKEAVTDPALCALFAKSGEGVLCTGVSLAKRGSYSRRCVSVQQQKYSRRSRVSEKQSWGKWTDTLYFPTQLPSLWIKVSTGICIMLTAEKSNHISVTEYVWINTTWSTLQKRHQLWGQLREFDKDQEVVAAFSQSFSPPTHTHLLTPENCQITNEQVDVWLWLQHHLLFNEEAGPHSLLLGSPLLQPYFRTAAATGHWLPSSAKGNRMLMPTDISTSTSIYVLSPICRSWQYIAKSTTCEA